jgi:putative ABC transport system permease protein
VVNQEDARALAAVPEIQYAGLWVQLFMRMEYQGVSTQIVTVYGADQHYMEILGGTLLRGRFFTSADLTGRSVTVLEAESAERLFGQVDPLGRDIRIGGVAFTVVGIYQRPANIFEPPGQQIGAIVPFETARHNYHYDETNGLFISAKAWPNVPVPRAKDLAIVALRHHRRLRPAMPNTFDVITQDQILDTVSNLTTAFFAVMVALSSVALLVGGIGVMAIMMVSVTDRTREIGLRKAVGATKQEILWQFLVEAATLTLVGGLIGIGVGLLLGVVLRHFLNISAGVPVWATAIATLVSVAIGLTFGLYPANRAARMDPVEALRHE